MTSTPALFIPPLILFNIRSRSKLALRSDCLSLEVEQEWHGDEQRGDATQQSHAVVDAHTVEHVGSEEREDGAKETSHDGVCCDRGRGKHEISIDDVVQAALETLPLVAQSRRFGEFIRRAFLPLEENGVYPESKRQSCQSRNDPWRKECQVSIGRFQTLIEAMNRLRDTLYAFQASACLQGMSLRAVQPIIMISVLYFCHVQLHSPSQNSPIEKLIPPAIVIGSLHSGTLSNNQ